MLFMIDPLDMTVREFLTALFEKRSVDDDDWINIRGEAYPWKRIVAAAERGECEVSRVGRRLMMQRSELSRWLARHRIAPRIKPEPKSELSDSVQRALERNGFGAPKAKPTKGEKKYSDVVERMLARDDVRKKR